MANIHTNLKFTEIYFGEKLQVTYSVEYTGHSYKWTIQEIEVLGNTNIQWLLMNGPKTINHLSKILDSRAKADWFNAENSNESTTFDNVYFPNLKDQLNAMSLWK